MSNRVRTVSLLTASLGLAVGCDYDWTRESASDAGSDSAADAVSADGPADGGSTGCVRRHTLLVNSGVWQSEPLAGRWSGPNAPGCEGIAAVAYLAEVERVFVFMEDGALHVQSNGAWQPPIPQTQLFPGVPSPVASAFETPYAWLKLQTAPPGVPAGQYASLTLTTRTHYYTFLHSHTQGEITPWSDGPMVDTGQSEGPPRPDHAELWAFTRMDFSKPPDHPEAFELHAAYANGFLYRLSSTPGTPQWFVFTASTSALFSIPGAPSPHTCVAAYFDQSAYAAVVLCP